MASLRSRGEIVLATTSFGIAATLLPGGRTAHSRFKIPIDIQPSSICGIEKKKDLANLIRVAAAIIWDEAPMTNKNCLEALDRSLQDICSNNAPFGGKSHLWNHTKILRLRQNMRSLHDQEFAEFLIRIGDGVEPTKPDDMVRLPLHIAIPWEGEHSIQVLIQHIFPNLELHGWDAPYMVQRAILTPTNDDVQKLNDMIIDQFPGEEHNLLSFDEVEGDNHNLYQQEFLNSIAQAKLEHDEISQLCKELRRKNVETCSNMKITDYEDKWNTWKDEQSISSIDKLDNKFFKSQERIDKGMYEELIRIFIREKENTSNRDSMFGIPLKERH
ncbi:uncharacterized protein LOC127122319 [Lathyrus oleraceus]|uniref:uncharacterized protein LOC127122319 n=1 Tax=Pisum sativum TaxID=3888 RepID=UPI0021CFBE52|nr:uncharacterized protein LOC127122319 [Pisum sativum]